MGEAGHLIVAGVDGSAAGQRALEWAIEEGASRQGRVRAVTAWSWDGLEALGAATSPREALERAQKMLGESVDKVLVGMDAPPEVERICARGVSSEALCAAAADADMLVLGSHGHGAVHDKLIGSTSERAIHHAPCPVVVVPDPRHAEKNRAKARERQRHLGTQRPAEVV